MNKILSISEEAVKQIKKIICNAPADTEGLLVGVDNSGCSIN